MYVLTVFYLCPRVIGIYNIIVSSSILLLLFSCDLEEIPEEIPTTFQKTFGGTSDAFGYAVQQTKDGGYIIAGSIRVEGGESDVYLIKTDSLGVCQLDTNFGGILSDNAGAVLQTADEGYIVMGTTEIEVGNFDVYLVKLSSDFVVEFEKKYGGAENDYGRSVHKIKEGGYILTGSTCSYGNGCDAYLIRTNDLGDTIFTKRFGGTGVESGESVQETDDEGFILTGYTSSSGPPGTVKLDVYLVKTNSNGDTEFVQNFGDLFFDEQGNAVQQTKDKGYIITGTMDDTGGEGNDIYVIKTDSGGKAESKRRYGKSMKNDVGEVVQQTDDLGYIVIGSTEMEEGDANVYLLKLKVDLNIDFERPIGGNKNDNGIAGGQTMGGGYIIAGVTYSFNTANPKVYLIKTDPDGLVYQEVEQINSCTF